MIYKVFFTRWFTVTPEVVFVRADSEDVAYKKVSHMLGYEGGDIKTILPSSEEEVINTYVL